MASLDSLAPKTQVQTLHSFSQSILGKNEPCSLYPIFPYVGTHIFPYVRIILIWTLTCFHFHLHVYLICLWDVAMHSVFRTNMKKQLLCHSCAKNVSRAIHFFTFDVGFGKFTKFCFRKSKMQPSLFFFIITRCSIKK